MNVPIFALNPLIAVLIITIAFRHSAAMMLMSARHPIPAARFESTVDEAFVPDRLANMGGTASAPSSTYRPAPDW